MAGSALRQTLSRSSRLCEGGDTACCRCPGRRIGRFCGTHGRENDVRLRFVFRFTCNRRVKQTDILSCNQGQRESRSEKQRTSALAPRNGKRRQVGRLHMPANVKGDVSREDMRCSLCLHRQAIDVEWSRSRSWLLSAGSFAPPTTPTCGIITTLISYWTGASGR